MRKTKRFTSLAAVAMLGLHGRSLWHDDTESATTDAAGVTAAPGDTPHPTRRPHQTPQPHPTAPPRHRRATLRRSAWCSTSAVVVTSRSTTQLRRVSSAPRASSASRSPRRRPTTTDRIARNCSTSLLSPATSSSPSASCSRATLPRLARPTPTRRSASSTPPMLDFTTDPTGATPYGDNIAGLVFSEEQGSFLVGAAAALKSTTGQHRFHRWRQGRRRSDREVRSRLQGRSQGCESRHRDRLELHHRGS